MWSICRELFLLFVLFSFSKGSDSVLNAPSEIETCLSLKTNEASPSAIKSELEITYEDFMIQVKLKPFQFPYRFNYKKPAEAKKLVKLIVCNFVEAQFYGFNHHFHRYHASDKLSLDDRYPRNVLYNVMFDADTMEFLGPLNCLSIIRDIIQEFKCFIDFDGDLRLSQLFSSIAVQLTDFLEFVLNELAPKYPYKTADPEFSIEAQSEFEYPLFILLIETVPIKIIALFREIDLLRVIVQRYKSIWPASITRILIKEALNFFGYSPNMFRQVFSLLVRSTPEYFLLPSYMRQYIPFAGQYWNLCDLMANMAPIFRALTGIDTETVQEMYLENYYSMIRTFNGPCLKSDSDALLILNLFIMDSKFSIHSSVSMFERKRTTLLMILRKFFGIEPVNYYSILRNCLAHTYLALYEAILQYLSADFVMSQAELIDLFELLIFDNEIEQILNAISITLGYLEFDDLNGFLESFELRKERVDGSSDGIADENQPPRRIVASEQEQQNRIRWIKELKQFMDSCPIEGKIGLFVEGELELELDGRNGGVLWPCPETVLTFSQEENHKMDTKLFHFAQALLIKHFDIPVFSVSLFESDFNECVAWSETLGFINLMIETMASHLGYENKNFFKFRSQATP